MKRFSWLLSLALLVVAAPGFAQSGAKNHPLTSQEAADGWIMLFDGETPFGWKSHGEAKWEVKNGEIAVVPNSGKGYFATTTEFPNYQLHAEFWADDKVNSGVFLRCPTGAAVDGSAGYEVNIFDKHPQWPTGSINTVQKTRSAQKTTGKWNSFDITAEGDHLTVLLNGKKAVDAHDRKFARGLIALQYNGEGSVRFRNLKLRPVQLESIFNGKDLTGWKEVPGHKAIYSVTPEGWLNVKAGEGDLQTEQQWKDFVLQIDCISNGDHLNSGVFFRTLPGQFRAGYEAQIRNQWMGDDRTKPVDYGTGAVYNRQPARMVPSSDREWFKMTVVAHQNHIAIWVNGYQTADFTDNRPANANGRNGAKTDAGTLGLQGHDPTTDISFRNIRIAEMPGK